MFLTGKDLFMYRFNQVKEVILASVSTLAIVSAMISMFIIYG